MGKVKEAGSTGYPNGKKKMCLDPYFTLYANADSKRISCLKEESKIIKLLEEKVKQVLP